jgi:hypothetical protein
MAPSVTRIRLFRAFLNSALREELGGMVDFTIANV